MIWIIGGTSEAKQLASKLNSDTKYIMTVATDDEKKFSKNENIRVGKINKEQMLKLCNDDGIELIVDMSHPYAKAVSRNAREVAKVLKIDYIRHVKDAFLSNFKGLVFSNFYDLCEYLEGVKGTVFFTNGSKHIGDFQSIKGKNRFIYRLSPTNENIENCKKYGVEIRNIVAMMGPFSQELNESMFNEFKVDYVVSKDSGKNGGMFEKIKACENLGITPILVGREAGNGYDSIDDIEQIIKKGL